MNMHLVITVNLYMRNLIGAVVNRAHLTPLILSMLRSYPVRNIAQLRDVLQESIYCILLGSIELTHYLRRDG